MGLSAFDARIIGSLAAQVLLTALNAANHTRFENRRAGALFSERVLPRAADLWVQSSLDQRQRFQQLFFPEGIVFDGRGFVRTAVTAVRASP